MASFQRIAIAVAVGLVLVLFFKGQQGLHGNAIGELPSPEGLTFSCTAQPGGPNYYVDGQSLCGPCSDGRAKAENAVLTPWCTMARAATLVEPGDSVFVQPGKYPHPFSWTISGTANAPITWKALGDVIVGTWDDLDDSQATPVPGYPHVYKIPYYHAWQYNDLVYQTFFDPILVDDDNENNPSFFFLQEEDGPLLMANVTSIAEVDRVEGSYFVNAAYETIAQEVYIHPYNHRVPSASATDVVVGITSWSHGITGDYNIYDGFTFDYNSQNEMAFCGGEYCINVGEHNRFLNIKGLKYFGGNDNYAENISSANMFFRTQAGDYSFFDQGEGWGFVLGGERNTVKNVHVYHNFNNFLLAGTDNKVIGAHVHGAPNHGFENSDQTNGYIANLQSYGVQDVFYLRGGIQNALYEGITVQGIIGFEEHENHGKNNGITFRNVIFDDCWIAEVGYGVQSCEYEPTITIENSIFFCDAGETLQIQHCVGPNMVTDLTYSYEEYVTKCANHDLTNCMTLRNIQVITDNYDQVVEGGRYQFHTDSWDIHLPSGSPAIDAGAPSLLLTEDFEGDIRPQGAGYDIGADEFAECGLADLDCDGFIDNQEISGMIAGWIQGQVPMADTISAIKDWKDDQASLH
jgi:hypothetical protein